jgi:hypothetical protein
LKKIEKAQGQRADLCGEHAQVGKLKALSNAGISHQQASEWERLASVPKDKFEEALATRSVAALLKEMAPSPLRIGTAASGFMASRMRGSSAIRGRASGRCIGSGRIEPRHQDREKQAGVDLLPELLPGAVLDGFFGFEILPNQLSSMVKV